MDYRRSSSEALVPQAVPSPLVASLSLFWPASGEASSFHGILYMASYLLIIARHFASHPSVAGLIPDLLTEIDKPVLA